MPARIDERSADGLEEQVASKRSAVASALVAICYCFHDGLRASV